MRIRVANDGRAVARFPALRVLQGSLFFETNALTGDLSIWEAGGLNTGWWSYRGGANHVVYPGEELTIVTLVQHGQPGGRLPMNISPASAIAAYFDFAEASITAEVICDSAPPSRITFLIPRLSHSATAT